MPSMIYQRIGPHHLAHLRAVADGLEVRQCARIYLGIEDPREAEATHNELTARLRLAARQAGEKHYRLIGIRIREKTRQAPALAERPTLAEFIDARGLDGWSENEQLEMYEAEFPVTPGTTAALETLQRRERSRQRVVEILRRLELDGSMTATPRPSDEVHAWLPDHLARRLLQAGFLTIGSLAERIRQGGNWYAGIAAVGKTKAGQIRHQIEAILPGSTSRVTPFDPTASTGGMLATLPSSSGEMASGSAYRIDNLGAIDSDVQALQAWVQAAANSDATRKSYEREARRFLLWLQLERGGRQLIDCKLDDALAYRAFLAFIPEGWISRAKAAPGTAGWTPFKGQISAASQAQAMTIIGAWFDWLVNAEYLRGNPWRLIKKAGQVRAEDSRALDTKAITERAMGEIEAFIERQDPSPARARARFILSFLSSTGLRSAELLSASVGDIRTEAEGVFLRVTGKREKVRDVLLVDHAVQVVDDYLHSRGLGGVEHAPADAPLLSSLQDGMRPVGYQTLYKTTRRWMERAVMFSGLTQAEKSRLAGASAHWLRHTFGTRAVALGTPFDVVQAQLGHVSINTTMSLYSRAPLSRRAAELRKAWGSTNKDT